MEEDFEIDDIIKQKKKKKNSSDKGKRVERLLCKLLQQHFNESFERSIGSGNRWSQVGHLPQHAKDTFIGDICPPENFNFVIESKGGYEDEIDLNGIFQGNAFLEKEFLKKALDESERSGRKPLVCWKRARRPWLGMIRKEDLRNVNDIFSFEKFLVYNEWVIVDLEQLLLFYGRPFFFR